jgi:hypothetical protein
LSWHGLELNGSELGPMEQSYEDSIINLKFHKRRWGLFTCQVSTVVYKEKNRFPYSREETEANQTAKHYVFPHNHQVNISIKILKKKIQYKQYKRKTNNK